MLRQKIKDLQSFKQEKEKELTKQIVIRQEKNLKIEQEQKVLVEQLKKLNNKKVDNNKKYHQLKAIETQLFLEKNIILNKIIKDNFNTKTWDNFIKGMKLTGVAFKGGIKGGLGAAAGLVGTAGVVTCCILGGGSSSGGDGGSCSIPTSVGIGIGGGCIAGVVTSIAILCPTTVPVAIASSGITIATGSIVEGTRSVKKS